MQFKVSIDMWDKIERFAKSAAKRAKNIPAFIEKFKSKMKCSSMSTKWMEVGLKNDIGLFSRENKEGEVDLIEIQGKTKREFMTLAIRMSNEKKVVAHLRDETAWIILLVRERLEREKPQEKFIEKMEKKNDE